MLSGHRKTALLDGVAAEIDNDALSPTLRIEEFPHEDSGHLLQHVRPHFRMAEAVAEGAKAVPGAEVTLFQVAELVPDAALQKSEQCGAADVLAHSRARAGQLADADAIIFGTPTRFGNMARRCATSWIRPAGCGPGR